MTDAAFLVLTGFLLVFAGREVLGGIKAVMDTKPIPFILFMLALAILLVATGSALVIFGLTGAWLPW